MSLSAVELAQMRADLATLLPDTCVIKSVTRTSDGAGGWTDTWGTATASVACRLDALSGREELAGNVILPFRGYILTVPYDTTLTEDYRIVHEGVTYNVLSVDTDKSWPISKRATLERANE